MNIRSTNPALGQYVHLVPHRFSDVPLPFATNRAISNCLRHLIDSAIFLRYYSFHGMNILSNIRQIGHHFMWSQYLSYIVWSHLSAVAALNSRAPIRHSLYLFILSRRWEELCFPEEFLIEESHIAAFEARERIYGSTTYLPLVSSHPIRIFIRRKHQNEIFPFFKFMPVISST